MTMTLPGADDIHEWRRRTKRSLADELAEVKQRAEWSAGSVRQAKSERDSASQMHNVLAQGIRLFNEWANADAQGAVYAAKLEECIDHVRSLQVGDAFRIKPKS